VDIQVTRRGRKKELFSTLRRSRAVTRRKYARSRSLKSGSLSETFTRDFGSFERWCSEFAAIGKSLRGGSGWALCSWSIRANCLVNHWSADHAHLMAGVTPITALDMYEHSYHMDYGANVEAYVEAFMRNIDWEKANARYVRAVE
jgi:superoxide dismutase, Fe-Mn family